MRKITKAFAILSASLLFGCGYENTALPGGVNPREGSSGGLPIGTVTDFATVKVQVFEPYCLSCHSTAGGNRGGVNLESYASVAQVLSRIQSAVVSGVMPPRSPLPEDRKALLLAWIQSGAPEANGSPTTGPVQPAPCGEDQTDDDDPKNGADDDCEDPQPPTNF